MSKFTALLDSYTYVCPPPLSYKNNQILLEMYYRMSY